MPTGSLTNPYATGSWKGLDLISQALLELGVISPIDSISAEDGGIGLTKLNRVVDSWNADERFVYAKQFFIGTLTPNLQPHLIGPGGTATFIMNQRPVKIEAANILLNYPGPTTVRVRVEVQDDMWWANNLAPSIQSVIPTDLYYEPDWPNGAMFLWVVPTVAYPLELELWTVLAQLAFTDSFFLPPGYLNALVLDLAKELSPIYERPWTETQEENRRTALRRIQAPNLKSPRMGTCDAGIPKTTSGNRSNYNYLSKQFNS